MTASPNSRVASASLGLLDRARLYLVALDSEVVALVSAIVYLGASLVPWDASGADLWSFEVGRLGGLSALTLLVWRVSMLVRSSAPERLVALRCATLGSVAVVAAADQLILILFDAEPPRLIYRGAVSWGEWVTIAATVGLAAATIYCWRTHLRDWPPTAFGRRDPALLVAGSSALTYVVLCVATSWFTYCAPVTATGATPSSLKNVQSLFTNVCSSESYRASALGELTSFLSLLLLASVAMAAFERRPVERLARSVTGGLSVGVGLLATFVVIEALRTRSAVTEHVQLGGWLAMLVAIPLVSSGLSLIRRH